MKLRFVPSLLIILGKSTHSAEASDDSKDKNVVHFGEITDVLRSHLGREDHRTIKTTPSAQQEQSTKRVPSSSSSYQGKGRSDVSKNGFNPDVGILRTMKQVRSASDIGDVPRFLVGGYTTQNCNKGTCAPFVCDCYNGGGSNCVAEAYDLCNGYVDADGKEWTAAGCASPYAGQATDYFQNSVDEIVAYEICYLTGCLAKGGGPGECLCKQAVFSCPAIREVYEVSTTQMNTRFIIFCYCFANHLGILFLFFYYSLNRSIRSSSMSRQRV